MAVERRTLWLGGVLVVALVAAIVLRSMDDGGAVAGRPVAPRPAAPAQGTAAAIDSIVDVKLKALASERGEPAEQGRNPFRFRPKPLPPPPPPSPAAIRQAEQQAALAAAPPRPTGPPPPPPITLKLIGLLTKTDGTKIAVLSDGKRPIHGVEGQEIEGQYKILKIGTESIEIAYIDGRGRQTLRLPTQ
jgi:hypothetical protein